MLFRLAGYRNNALDSLLLVNWLVRTLHKNVLSSHMLIIHPHYYRITVLAVVEIKPKAVNSLLRVT